MLAILSKYCKTDCVNWSLEHWNFDLTITHYLKLIPEALRFPAACLLNVSRSRGINLLDSLVILAWFGGNWRFRWKIRRFAGKFVVSSEIMTSSSSESLFRILASIWLLTEPFKGHFRWWDTLWYWNKDFAKYWKSEADYFIETSRQCQSRLGPAHQSSSTF